MSLHHHLVIPELLGNVASARSRDLDPGLGEEGARCQDEDQVKNSVEGVVDDLRERCGRRDVVSDPAHGDALSPVAVLPLAQNANQDVGRRAVVQQLRDEVEIRDQGRLKNDRHVRRVEELDGVGPLLTAVLLVLDGEYDPPTLEVDDHDEDEYRGRKVG